jgi:ferrous iron transport protein A
MKSRPRTLKELGHRQTGVITGYDPAMPAACRERFEDLGLLPETAIQRERRAPLGDPIVYRVRGTLLCLRSSEASLIYVSMPSK